MSSWTLIICFNCFMEAMILKPAKEKLIKLIEKVKTDFEDFENFVEEGFEDDDEKGTC